MQLLQVLHIVDSGNAVDRRGALLTKANLQHIKKTLNGVFSVTLLRGVCRIVLE